MYFSFYIFYYSTASSALRIAISHGVKPLTPLISMRSSGRLFLKNRFVKSSNYLAIDSIKIAPYTTQIILPIAAQLL